MHRGWTGPSHWGPSAEKGSEHSPHPYLLVFPPPHLPYICFLKGEGKAWSWVGGRREEAGKRRGRADQNTLDEKNYFQLKNLDLGRNTSHSITTYFVRMTE